MPSPFDLPNYQDLLKFSYIQVGIRKNKVYSLVFVELWTVFQIKTDI